jgi:hypothetical protein
MVQELAILATHEVVQMSADPAKAATAAHGRPEAKDARISVNGQDVVVTKERMSGLEIKEAAIRAGVPIQADFVLSEVNPGGQQKIIADEREVPVKTGDEFWAIPGDDNS